MSAIIKNALHNSISEAIFNEILTKSGRYYYFLGKSVFWNGTTDDPESPTQDFVYEMDTRRNIVFTKLVNANDVMHVIPRINWTPNTVYDMYDDLINPDNLSSTGKSSIESANFYVLNKDFNVYKCIWNENGAPSTEEPIGQDLTTQTYADGYKWKYMYNVSASLRLKFLTADVMPVTTALKNQFYSNGAIQDVTIDDGGSGYTVTPSITVTGDGYLEENPYIITGVSLEDGGDGYTVTPNVTISAPFVDAITSIQATAHVSLSGDTVVSPVLDNAGYGYLNNATIDVDPPFTGAVAFQFQTYYTDGDYIVAGFNYYLVVGSGLSGNDSPIHTSGSVVSGDITLTYAGRLARLSLQTLKTEAILTPVVSGGEIINVIVDDGGIGYSYVTLTVVGVGTGAVLSANLSQGSLNTIQSSVELMAVSGSIESAVVTDGGLGYGQATVEIVGDGTGATAEAVITNGIITKINITNIGQGYSKASIIISGNGIGATARAIMSPFGGHGSNAINELYAKTLCVYTNIYGQENQGLVVNNDYRQAGIIKQLNRFNSGLKYKNQSGSSCYKITTTLNPVDFPKDSIVYQGTDKEFLVIESYSNAILLLPLDNSVPTAGLFRNASNVTFIVGADDITPPQIDRFSGDLLFIDNRSGFTPSQEQNIVFRTILQF